MYVREIEYMQYLVQDDSTWQCSFTQQCFGKHKRQAGDGFSRNNTGCH